MHSDVGQANVAARRNGRGQGLGRAWVAHFSAHLLQLRQSAISAGMQLRPLRFVKEIICEQL